VEFAVVEVGLGGRLDATNVVQPEVAVITPIDFDHEAFLGKGAASISAEKAGILKKHAKAVFAPQHLEVRRILEQHAHLMGISAVQVGEDWKAQDISHQQGFYRFAAVGRDGVRVRAQLSLAGEHQMTNALAAIAALRLLQVEIPAVERGLREAQWPGRLEHVAEHPLILLDGAHNPAGARALVRYLEQHQGGKKVWLIYGAMRDKAVEEVAGILFPAVHKVFLTQVAQPRALSVGVLRTLVDHHHSCIEVTANTAEAVSRARAEASEADIILITGSLFLVGEAKELTSG